MGGAEPLDLFGAGRTGGEEPPRRRSMQGPRVLAALCGALLCASGLLAASGESLTPSPPSQLLRAHPPGCGGTRAPRPGCARRMRALWPLPRTGL